jgi:hypothetical protein
MDGKAFKRFAKVELQYQLGTEPLDETIFEKAMAKAKRHMRNKYGSFDYNEEINESGYSNVVYFYHETQKEPSGINTFNHDIAKNRGN